MLMGCRGSRSAGEFNDGAKRCNSSSRPRQEWPRIEDIFHAVVLGMKATRVRGAMRARVQGSARGRADAGRTRKAWICRAIGADDCDDLSAADFERYVAQGVERPLAQMFKQFIEGPQSKPWCASRLNLEFFGNMLQRGDNFSCFFCARNARGAVGLRRCAGRGGWGEDGIVELGRAGAGIQFALAGPSMFPFLLALVLNVHSKERIETKENRREARKTGWEKARFGRDLPLPPKWVDFPGVNLLHVCVRDFWRLALHVCGWRIRFPFLVMRCDFPESKNPRILVRSGDEEF
jgi:hypothetical protein